MHVYTCIMYVCVIVHFIKCINYKGPWFEIMNMLKCIKTLIISKPITQYAYLLILHIYNILQYTLLREIKKQHLRPQCSLWTFNRATRYGAFFHVRDHRIWSLLVFITKYELT